MADDTDYPLADDDKIGGFPDSDDYIVRKPMSESETELLEYLNSAPKLYTRIGSSALFEDNGTDYDFICHEKHITNFIIDRTFAFDIRNYVNVLPMGNGWLFKTDNDNIDILVYDDERDVEALKKTMNFLLGQLHILEDFLRNKGNRVALFESVYKKFQEFERRLSEN